MWSQSRRPKRESNSTKVILRKDERNLLLSPVVSRWTDHHVVCVFVSFDRGDWSSLFSQNIFLFVWLSIGTANKFSGPSTFKANKFSGPNTFKKGNPKFQKDKKFDNKSSNGSAAVPEKKDWNQLKKDKKELKLKRKQTKDLFELTVQGKKIYEKLKW